MRRWPYLVLAWVALALGLVGIVLPGLPTTPFVLLAAWAAARGSVRLHRWMRAHKVLGRMIRDWEEQRAVGRRAKWSAIAMMAASAVIFFLTAPRAWMAIAGTAVMALVATWLWLRPEPKR